jgi:hypothetical protein
MELPELPQYNSTHIVRKNVEEKTGQTNWVLEFNL